MKIEEKRQQSGFARQEEIEDNFSRYIYQEKKIKEASTTFYNTSNYGKGGVPLSWNDDKEWVAIDQTDAHTLVIGPTGSKKSRLVAMPLVKILGRAGESMIICDPKAEIYDRLGKELADENYHIDVFNLRNPDQSACWNPLSIPYHFYCEGNVNKAYEFVNDIAVNLVTDVENKKDPFWYNSASSLFFGMTILLFKYCKEYNLPKHMVHMGNIIYLRWHLLEKKRMVGRNFLWEYGKRDEIIRNALVGTVETANDTKAGILSIFDERMQIFSMQSNIMDLMSENNILFERLQNEKTALFLLLPDEKTTYHRLVSLIVKQSYEYIIYCRQRDRDNKKIRINYVLDEFSSLPTIRDFPAMISAARSRNIRFNLFVQSKNQLVLRYVEESETILSNCTNWIFLFSREVKFLQELSELCGVRYTDSGKKPLLDIAELQQMSKGDVLLLIGRFQPYLGRLLDIDSYDGREYKLRKIPDRVEIHREEIDFSALLEAEKERMKQLAQTNGQDIKVPDENVSNLMYRLKTPMDENSMSSEDIDKMIAYVDKKIEELDKEEQRVKEQKKKEEEEKQRKQDTEKKKPFWKNIG